MFLKTLTIKGFKSFADTAALDLEPGVTVVVGPNGSGKSNVVDAIGWVLGAQAPSAVRSQKMDDVIFAGTTKRSALGRAEVALTIDNTSGQLPIEFNEVTITRTLFRSGDSEYSINGVPCRLLDVQELLSDSGVGRQQHVIISQGQIDAVLNARPEERRLIIEEAAGVLKYRRRKEKAERRLNATEGNLTRVEDLLREVRRQLRPLEKQADAARRHQGLVDELRALRVHLAGRDLARLKDRSQSATQRGTELAERERTLRTTLVDLDTAVMNTERELSAMGGHDLSDSLGRFESLREKARGQRALITERLRSVARERAAAIDQTVIANLEAEGAALVEELAEVDRATAELAPAAAELEEAMGALAQARAAFQERWADGVEAPRGEAAEVRGELSALGQAMKRAESEIERVLARHGSASAKAARRSEEIARFATELAESRNQIPTLQQAADDAKQTLADARQNAEIAADARRAAEGEQRAWIARADALFSALDEARAKAGAEQLADLDGVVGTLLDVVEVDDGWQEAFEAGAGESIAAVVVDGIDVARAAVAHLRQSSVTGAVLALGYQAAPPRSPSSHATLRSHVRSTRPGVDALLDLLVGDVLVADAWSAAVDLAIANPAQVVVTQDGDRLGPTGWRVGGTSSGATGAALAEATHKAEQATEIAARAINDDQMRRQELDDAQAALSATARAAEQMSSRVGKLEADLARSTADRDDAQAESTSLATHVEELQRALARDSQRAEELTIMLPKLEAEEAEFAAQARAMADARQDLEDQAANVANLRSDIEVRSAGLSERREMLARRSREIEERLAHDAEQRRSAELRRVELDRVEQALTRIAEMIAAHSAVLESHLHELREQRRFQSDASRKVAVQLTELRTQRQTAERELENVRAQHQRIELEAAEINVRLEQAIETLRNDLDTSPEEAVAAPLPDLGEGVAPAARVRELDRELRLMGAINPLAVEEFAAMTERHTFLSDQLEDVRSTRRDLGRVIKGIDAEIVTTFASAYSDVEGNFRQLFEMLFPGGAGGLKLTAPEDPLNTGIEIEARPSGKNVRKLSLLSGGERSLVALAYLFAVFRSRPSPFYVMDEVEAALDDINLHRFLDLVQEFRADAQLIIVSHQKRTMEAADCLYGVSMQPGGSSKVVSERAGGDA